MNLFALMLQAAEKMGLLAAAALFAVLLPPLRDRVLGIGARREKAAALVFGLALSIWGTTLGFQVMGEYVSVRTVGVLIAAILGGRKAGAVAGVASGLFFAARVDEQTAPWVLVASSVDGILAGLVAKHRPELFSPTRVFFTALGIQAVHLVIVGMGLLAVGHAARYLPAWPAHLTKFVVNAAGTTLFVSVARLVISREESAVALVKARADADQSALQLLRQRLEPHFLFNALNTLRATIRVNPDRARSLVDDLADLYRYLLSHPEDATLKEEYDHAHAYLAIEQARLGADRITVEMHLPDALAGVVVPALLLQPLVENAVRHGVAAHEGPGRVRVSARMEEGRVRVEVDNLHGGPRYSGDTTGNGIGLETLRRRLTRRFGPGAGPHLEAIESGMRAWLELPPGAAQGS